MENESNIQLIENFLDGILSPAEKADFENRLKTDLDLAFNLRIIKETRLIALNKSYILDDQEDEGLKRFKATLHAIRNEEDELVEKKNIVEKEPEVAASFKANNTPHASTKTVHTRYEEANVKPMRNSKKWLTIAASILFLVFGGPPIYGLIFPPTVTNVIAIGDQDSPLENGQYMGTRGQVDPATHFYEKDYEKYVASRNFDDPIDINKLKNNLVKESFMDAYALYKINRNKEAQVIFESLYPQKSWNDKVKYYASINLLKLNEVEKAKRLVKEISERFFENNPNRTKYRKKINKLKE